MITKDRWTPDSIAEGVLTWNSWPGFQGVNCDKCGCEMNVLGDSFGHKCIVCCDRNMCYQDMPGHNRICFDKPIYGPTWDTIKAGYFKVEEIMQKRSYAVGTRIIVRRRRYQMPDNIKTGIIVAWDLENSHLHMRYYYILTKDNKQELKRVLGNNITAQ